MSTYGYVGSNGQRRGQFSTLFVGTSDPNAQIVSRNPVVQGCQVADLSAIFADFGRMEKLLAEWKNPIRPNAQVHLAEWRPENLATLP
jgi:hypothetical protein